MAKTKYDQLVRIDTTPAHHKLQPGDWYQFIFDDAPWHDCKRFGVKAYQVGDVYVHQFPDESIWRQFRILAIPVEGVFECAYISQCGAP